MADVDRGEPIASAAHEIALRHQLAGLRERSHPPQSWLALTAVKTWLGRARTVASKAPPQASSAAEWLLDNDYLVQRAILQIHEDLPPGFCRKLPALGGGEGSRPRIHALAHALLQASHLQVSLNGAIQFVTKYQEHMPLSMAEIWAFPTMLRLACLELLVAGFTRLFPEVDPPFEPDAPIVSTTDIECVARAIANLPVISTIQWNDFFDRTSLVEAILSRDPASIYPLMDFETRDCYRHAVERLARYARLPEWEVAQKALAQCRSESDVPSGHVGYWLVDAGRPAFEDAIDSRLLALATLGRSLLRRPGTLYTLALFLAGLAAFALPGLYLASVNASPLSWLLGITLTALPAAMLSITLVNWLVTLVVPPRVLPKLDFEKAIAENCATAVVMPVLVARARDVELLLRRLEGHRLANPDPALQFVLLSDHSDAPEQVMPADRAIEQALVAGIEMLNARHGEGQNEGPFHLLHRPRLYNAAQDCWMGWERKRGKLEQFNAFILRGESAPFSLTAGCIEALRHIRFVVTADADTRLPSGVVGRMVGALAHPLNKARFDPRTGRVVRGYTILQPRVEIAPEATGRSLFTRFYGGDTTIDIYSRAVSDVYQDLLGTGVFVGKGIYEVASFERSLEGRIPENNLLSHDLFEGLHGRVALASDIIVYEGFPASYLDYIWRWHRWVRGDWQILFWLFPLVPGRGGGWLRNRLSWFDRLKIFDNLRRSLIPPSIVALLLGGWFVLDGNPLVWTLLALTAPAAYLFTDLVTGLARGRRRGVIQGTLRKLTDHIGRWLLAVAFLVSDSAISLHAICVTLWRLRSGQKLLEWTSAAQMATRLAIRNPRLTAWRDMAASPMLAITIAGVAILVAPFVLAVAAPLLLLWLFAPEIAVWIGRSLHPPVEEVTPADVHFLRLIARRTWLFFETFVRPEDNWLPPDNYQEPPDEKTAHRTSPTNIGMMLLSVLTAWRLGHIGLNEAEMRLRNALEAIDRLERYRGHILNWYDTMTLAPLEPRYVSTVDSGNLAVSLVVVEQALREARDAPPLDKTQWTGLADLLDLLTAVIRSDEGGDAAACIAAMRSVTTDALDKDADWSVPINGLLDRDLPYLRERVEALVSTAVETETERLREVQLWFERVEHHLLGMRRDMGLFAPWMPLLASPPADCAETAAELASLPGIRGDDAKLMADGAQANELLDRLAANAPSDAARIWAGQVRSAIADGLEARNDLKGRCGIVAQRSGAIAHGMDFALLFDGNSRLFHIGYNVSSDRIDPHHYDLLASEARLASFWAIAKRDVAPSHWFHLGRPITKKAAGLALVSWNGSMFEYLMPNLFLRSDAETLLGRSDRTAVDIQNGFGALHDMPWGISESSFASMGQDRVYRYHAFGVPDLGLRRGLGRDLVVAPYATALALATRPALAARNLRELASLGLLGRYGFYEAVDFTPERVPPGERCAVVHSYMAHHHGMSMAAFGNALCDDMLVHWFHADPHVQTIDLLLNERIPWELPPEISRVEFAETPTMVADGAVPVLQGWTPARSAHAHGWHIIGNGRLSTRIRTDGASGLKWQNQALTSLDPVDHEAGYGIFLRDRSDGRFWATAGDPRPAETDEGQMVFHAHQVEFHRRANGISASTTICVVQGDDLEIRRIALVNETDHPRTLDITSYAEVVLAPPLEAARHPAFSKLFIGAEAISGGGGLLFVRRPRDASERSPVLLHRMIAEDEGIRLLGVEADRRAFLGRHGSASDPAAMHMDGLSGSLGWTLDPIFALRTEIMLPAQGRREIAFVTIAAGSRDSALDVAERYATLSALDWAVNDAAAAAAREMFLLALSPSDVPKVQTLLAHLLQPRTGTASESISPALGRSDLWALSISGDHPILLLRAGDGEQTALLRFLLAAQECWRRRGLTIDLVVTHEGAAGYLEPVRERVLDVLREAGVQEQLGRDGGIHLIAIGPSDMERVALLDRVARLAMDENGGSFEDQLARSSAPTIQSPRFAPVGADTEPRPAVSLAGSAELVFNNGWGGFTPGGAYVVQLDPGETTPAPWSNVLANDVFGTIVTEAGLGFTWAVNSGENRLTPWSNDPVRDSQSERLYLRDEENGRFWTPTALPAGRDSACRITHDFGHTLWERASEGLDQELLAFVPMDDPVKLIRLRLRNRLPHARRITATYYAEWLLGAVDGELAPLRETGYDPWVHALLASNPWVEEFRERTAFLASSLPPHSFTTSRRDFHGAVEDAARPEALFNWDLGNRQISTGADCCAALQVHIDIPPEGTAEVVFVLGQGSDRADACRLARQWQDPVMVERALATCRDAWTQRLGAVTVKTPDPAFDLMVNRWLPYQAISARLRARAGFYQAGGAFGFRDQLQDVLALLHADPDAARRHILTAAAHQFEEGDVLHWWHPPSGRGVRTRCSDDLLWLPYAVASYVDATGDAAILAEELPFLHGPQLGSGEADRYARFDTTDYTQSLFAHCERALDRGHRLGAHGLPLIGAGDWNDGMNRVGDRGRGESVWLAWFLITTINGFMRLCSRLDRHDLVDRWTGRATALAAAVEREGWDGDWYLRAFDDDGRPWGTASERECRIDSIAQSWAVLSGAADPERARRAIASAQRYLLREDDELVRLLDPPFDRTPRDPGYIKAYPPGIRENGGQYTHAATWLGIALARLGEGDEAKRLFDRINPINRTATQEKAAQYRVEPYVMAGDVGGVAPQLGRGGWSWYTGAAAWTWRLAVEDMLGIHLVDGRLRLAPCLPTAWREAEVTLTRATGSLHIQIGNPKGLSVGTLAVLVDGSPWQGGDILFPNDGSVRQVDVRLGEPVGDAGENESPAAAAGASAPPPPDSFAK